MKRLADCLSQWAQATPDAPAVSDAHHDWSYRMLAMRVDEAACFLRERGVGAGDRVMLIGENGAALAALILAAGRLDAWAVLENARRAAMEVDAVHAHAQPRTVVFVVDNSPSAQAHAERHQAAAVAAPFGNVAVGDLDGASEAEPVDSDPASQVAAMIYTTGSTGKPKGVMLTHANLLHIGALMVRQRHLTHADRVYGILPITHVMGLSSGLIGTLSAGAHIRLVPRFSKDDCLRALREDGITILQGAPAMFARLVQAMPRGERLQSALRFIAVGGAPLDPALKAQTESAFGLTLHNGYGLTEASASAWTRLEEESADCSVGPPNPGMEARVLDARGKPVGMGGTGELWVRGPCVMKGYFRMPERTREVLKPDGWFNTQDLARLTPDGRIHIEGRSKDLIIRSGFNVSPLEVETALNAYEGVQYSAVLGVAQDGNEEIVAIVEPAPLRQLTEAALRDFLTQRLSPYKRPSRILFVQSLPVAPNGKVLKHRLREQLGDML
ncbi:AMP-binding protein [Allopusillimonas soli]|uniref:Acyl--CoA ligase n=1 Tax=Allopusillimonas soli TaxID=659016 RepID=A0A853FDL4_9BURK|nr:class I adenylate-forming enzyme family protein [Allopusillimonas soli]NYT37818.1 acyl--CoA ligase [Allopusillimonas soli]TEA73726.1 AMP-binding protein [Allopusillimonas soli]